MSLCPLVLLSPLVKNLLVAVPLFGALAAVLLYRFLRRNDGPCCGCPDAKRCVSHSKEAAAQRAARHKAAAASSCGCGTSEAPVPAAAPAAPVPSAASVTHEGGCGCGASCGCGG